MFSKANFTRILASAGFLPAALVEPAVGWAEDVSPQSRCGARRHRYTHVDFTTDEIEDSG